MDFSALSWPYAYDAYHRVVHRKSIDRFDDAAARPDYYHAIPEMCS